ncbi:MAG: magnesium transporter [Candidatus Altiarchaeota archaeon]|nr:magnesium transporter [Candidatus Altiarchaeota archaeon]
MNSDVRRILIESIPIQIICVVGGIGAGVILTGMEHDLLGIPGLLILLPASLGMRGNISGALGSRLASGLHLGLIEPEIRWGKPLSDNVWSAMFLNVLMALISGIIACIAYEITNVETHANVIQLTLISLIAGTIAGLFLTALSVYLAIATYSKGFDPDNVLMPALSTVGDVITVFCLFFAVKVVSLIPTSII